MELLLFWFGIGILCAVIAPSRGRGAFGWFCLGALLSPLALIALLALPKLEPEPAPALSENWSRSTRPADEKTCPRCAEAVKAAAVVCRFCGHEFGFAPAPQVREDRGFPLQPAERIDVGARVRQPGSGRGIGTVLDVDAAGFATVRFADGEARVMVERLSRA